MNSRIQLLLNPESKIIVESVLNESNSNFKVGNITISDVINEMILTSKVDVKALQMKRTDLRRSLRVMASQDELDIDTIIRNLNELRGKSAKRNSKTNEEGEKNV